LSLGGREFSIYSVPLILITNIVPPILDPNLVPLVPSVPTPNSVPPVLTPHLILISNLVPWVQFDFLMLPPTHYSFLAKTMV